MCYYPLVRTQRDDCTGEGKGQVRGSVLPTCWHGVFRRRQRCCASEPQIITSQDEKCVTCVQTPARSVPVRGARLNWGWCRKFRPCRWCSPWAVSPGSEVRRAPRLATPAGRKRIRAVRRTSKQNISCSCASYRIMIRIMDWFMNH